jgi:rubrerythrin
VDTQFNVFEVLQIAEEIEHRAATFYLKIAERFSDSGRRNICYNLASWRVKHEQAWFRLRNEYSERTGEFGTFDPDNYVRSNPHVMAGLPWFGAGSSLQGRPAGRETGTQIVRDAIRRAEGVWIFYHGLKEFAGDPASRSMIDAMIGEEDRHIRQLNRSLDPMLGSTGDFERPARSDSIGAVNHN